MRITWRDVLMEVIEMDDLCRSFLAGELKVEEPDLYVINSLYHLSQSMDTLLNTVYERVLCENKG
jgi:hypothetical protein